MAMTYQPDGPIYIQVSHRIEGDIINRQKVSIIDAIHCLQAAIAELRSMSASKFDPSFGEQPPALLAPSEEELEKIYASYQDYL